MPATFATFNGVNIFGAVVQMKTADNPRAVQQNAFAGVSGVEGLDHGSRGRYTTAAGTHAGAGLGGLAVVQETCRAYRDGRAYVLVDTRGVTWLYVQLVSYEPEGRIRYAGGGYCTQKYSLRFFHHY
jgi:hypothetical protein